MTVIVSDDMMSAAMQVLASDNHAEAKARYEKLERQRKVVLARLERESNEKSVKERETYALTHPHYAAFCEELEVAEKAYFVARDRRDSADAITRAWQTGKADARAAERIR
ncbi:hypothetical protein [Caulobacter sp. UC70_42]|uniref:hypothetical protein n=1 Tax=Caulobacter sp. UC70_42 TaxID=3374551 RepID=UPI00375635E3